MEKLLKLIRGKKSYIIGIIVAVLGVLQGLGYFTVPEYVWPILGAAGLGALRSGINKVAKEVKNEQ